jgi:DNA-directed RNA polymerase specialized sigma24 family protein
MYTEQSLDKELKMVVTMADDTLVVSHDGTDEWWREMYPSLRLLARRQIYTLHVPIWYGQESDMVEDVVQETARRVLERARKAECGGAPTIQMYEQMVRATICNYCKDLRRHDKRLVPFFTRNVFVEPYAPTNIDDERDVTEEVVDFIYQNQLFVLLAEEIIKFPAKQKNALLVDLANRMHFAGEPTPLQEAFLAVGIHLQEYQQPLPEDPKDRGRFAALVYCAYKRIAQNVAVQLYVSCS